MFAYTTILQQATRQLQASRQWSLVFVYELQEDACLLPVPMMIRVDSGSSHVMGKSFVGLVLSATERADGN
jgi:hypothetical protein